MDFDIIIVGGSFFGLCSAYNLAKAGFKVCLFEKSRIGEFTKSTGLLMDSAVRDLKIPKEYIENKIDGVSIFSPSMENVLFPVRKTKIYQSYTLEFLKWLKERSLNAGVRIFEKKLCRKINIRKGSVFCEGETAKLIIFACGPSKQSKIPFSKQKLYAGLEYIANVKFNKLNYWYMYFDYNIAPGYFSWIAPSNNQKFHIGVFKDMNDKTPLTIAFSNFCKKANITIKKIYETRCGVVPLSGPIKKPYGHRYIVIGDAAGQVGAFTSSGINYAARLGKILPKIISNCINNPTEKSLNSYATEMNKEIGPTLKEELKLRKLFDRLNSNDRLELFVKILKTIDPKKVDEFFYRVSNMKNINPKRLFFSEFPKIFAKLFI